MWTDYVYIENPWQTQCRWLVRGGIQAVRDFRRDMGQSVGAFSLIQGDLAGAAGRQPVGNSMRTFLNRL
jgi:hypothetical protein